MLLGRGVVATEPLLNRVSDGLIFLICLLSLFLEIWIPFC